MKKNLHLSAILFLASILIFVLRSLFFCSHPISVQFEVETQKNLRWQVLWTDRSDLTFNQSQSANKNTQSGTSKVEIKLPVTTIHKLRLDPGSYPGEVTIKNLRLTSGDSVFSFDNFKDFAYLNLTPKERDGRTFKLISGHIDPYIWYNRDFVFKAQKRMDWFAFSIISICSLLLSSVIINTAQYVMTRQSAQGKRNVVFSGVICCLLVLPVSKLNQGDILVEEKRKMALLPKVTNDDKGGMNYSFGKEFDKWISDRFFGRAHFISLYDSIKSFFSGLTENQSDIAYDNNWMFLKSWAKALNTAPSRTATVSAKNNLIKLQRWCNAREIKLYVLICPIKEGIYAEYNSTMIQAPQDAVQLFIREMQDSDLNIIYPKDFVKSHKDKGALLYYKTDTHQTEYGAYLIHQALMNIIRKDFSDIPLHSIGDFSISKNKQIRVGKELPFNYGHHAYQLKLNNDSVLDVEYQYYDDENSNIVHIHDTDDMQRLTHSSSGVRKAILLGDSYTYQQSIWLRNEFKELLKIRFNNGKEGSQLKLSRWEKQIEAFRPDVLILCINAGAVPNHFLNMY